MTLTITASERAYLIKLLQTQLTQLADDLLIKLEKKWDDSAGNVPTDYSEKKA